MIEEPLLVPTSQGPIAAIAGWPDDSPRALVLVVQGAAGTRAGLNQLWSRFARTLNAEGIATLRADYSGIIESWDADPRERVSGVRDLVRWFDERTGSLPLLVVANCYGLTPAAALARADRPLRSVAVLTPPLFSGLDALIAPLIKRKRRAVVGRVLKLPRTVAYRVRYGPPRQTAFEQAERGRPSEDLESLVERGPTWILVGSEDLCTPAVRELLPALQQKGTVELEIIDGIALYGAPSPAAQESITNAMLGWVHRSLETAGSDR